MTTMDEKKSPLSSCMALIMGKPYRVEDKPSDSIIRERGCKAFRKGVAYRFNSQLTKFLLPYRGQIEREDFRRDELEPGIYFVRRRESYFMRLVLPHNDKEREQYQLGKERDVVAAVIDSAYMPDQFADVRITSADAGGDSFLPPLYQEDDALNLLVKTGIRLKDAPFEPYGKRLAAAAVDKFKGVDGTNIRNNARRSFRLNHTMSATKALQYADAYEMRLAYVLADEPDAMHPMFPDDPGKLLVVYPNGIPFEIHQDDLVNADELIRIGIADTNQIRKMEEEE